MLRSVTIKNYTIIESLHVEFHPVLNIITGETGAGKSILVGAVSLLLGDRADTSTLKNKNEKCIAEGSFDITGYGLENLFEKHGLDYDDNTVIRREIAPSGKSRAFVNDTPVKLEQLKELGVHLADIHSQHQTLRIMERSFQLSVIDAVANNKELLKNYSAQFYMFREADEVLADLREKEKNAEARRDYIQFQYDELEHSSLDQGEQERLEQEREMLTHAMEISEKIAGTMEILFTGENNALAKISTARNMLSQLSAYNNDLEALHSRMDSTYIEMKDIVGGLENMSRINRYDDDRLRKVNERLDLIYHLEKKHHVKTVSELIFLKEEFQNDLKNISSLNSEIETQLKQRDAALSNALSKAEEITARRKKAIPAVEKKIAQLLRQMGMPDGILKIEIFPGNISPATGSRLSSDGADDIRFLFNANKGGDLKEMGKIASGGELSRLMFAIKSIVSNHTSLPAIIFDEIDSGISGDTADKMGSIMKAMAQKMQVIVITHLPQIAGKGDAHFVAFKTSENGTTNAGLNKLTGKERIDEIARMLSGEKLTKEAKENAKVMLRER